LIAGSSITSEVIKQKTHHNFKKYVINLLTMAYVIFIAYQVNFDVVNWLIFTDSNGLFSLDFVERAACPVVAQAFSTSVNIVQLNSSA
jgi:hypothetical protein